MIVSDVMTRVRRSFGDESGVQITDADLIRWINDGQRELIKHNETVLETVATANIVANQQEYSLPANLLILKHITFKADGWTSYNPLQAFSFSQFNMMVDSWDGTQNPPDSPSIYTRYANNLILFPVPSVSLTSALKIYYNRQPVDITNASDALDVPIQYHEVLVKYCQSQAYEMDEDWDAAQIKDAATSSDIALLRGREDWNIQEFYPIISIREEDMY